MSIINYLEQKLFNVFFIDFGTSDFKFENFKGVSIVERSRLIRYKDTKKILALGNETQDISASNLSNIEVIDPIKMGTVQDYYSTELLVATFLTKLFDNKKFIPKLIGDISYLSIPTRISEVQISAMIDALKNAGVRKTHLIESPIASLYGIKSDAGKGTHIIIDIGLGKANINLISFNKLIKTHNIDLCGYVINKKISNYLNNKYNILITENVAEGIKRNKELTLLKTRAKSQDKIKVSGQDSNTGMPKQVEVDIYEVREAIVDIFEDFVNEIIIFIEAVSPEISEKLITEGLYLTGGEIMNLGVKEYITSKLKLKFNSSSHPNKDSVVGMKKIYTSNINIKTLYVTDLLFK